MRKSILKLLAVCSVMFVGLFPAHAIADQTPSLDVLTNFEQSYHPIITVSADLSVSGEAQTVVETMTQVPIAGQRYSWMTRRSVNHYSETSVPGLAGNNHLPVEVGWSISQTV